MNDEYSVTLYHKVRVSTGGQKQCPVCANPDIRIFLEAGPIPIHADLLWQRKEDALSAPMGEIQLGYCSKCGHIFNTAYNPDLLNYSRWFENSLHQSSRFQSYSRLEIDHLVEKYKIKQKSVLEIGRGPSQFSLLFSELAENHSSIYEPCESDGYTTPSGLEIETDIHEWFSDPYSRFKPDLICCQNVLEHILHPREFINSLRRSMNSEQKTIGYFEVHNSLVLLENSPSDVLTYERYSLFSPSSLALLFSNNGFRVLQLRLLAEDRILVIEVNLPSDETFPISQNINIDADKAAKSVEVYRNRFMDVVTSMDGKVKEFKQSGKRVFCWGANRRAAIMLNLLCAQDSIQGIVDTDFNKLNYYVPGTGQRVVAPGSLKSLEPDVIINFDHEHDLEIRQLISAMRLDPEIITA